MTIIFLQAIALCLDTESCVTVLIVSEIGCEIVDQIIGSLEGFFFGKECAGVCQKRKIFLQTASVIAFTVKFHLFKCILAGNHTRRKSYSVLNILSAVVDEVGNTIELSATIDCQTDRRDRTTRRSKTHLKTRTKNNETGTTILTTPRQRGAQDGTRKNLYLQFVVRH